MIHPKLTRLELQIMETLWAPEVSSICEIQEAFPEQERRAHTTIQTTVHRLEGKRAVRLSTAILGLLLALAGNPVLAQDSSIPLSPSEAYKSAMAPFNAAKAQPGDLTDADKLALGIGMASATRDCLALSAENSTLPTDPKELLALAELCIFGQQYEPARAHLVRYLALPQPPARKLALVLLIRALLGLNTPDSAEPEVRLLLRDYAYDAQIHFAMDQVIDGLEARSTWSNQLALQLCATQDAVTLPLLARGEALVGKDLSASPSELFADGVRCAALAEELGKIPTPDTLPQLSKIAQQPGWAGTADLAPMRAALSRQMSVGARAPLAALHGYLLSNGKLVTRSISLGRGNIVLLPFTLWAPSASDVAVQLGRLAPQQPVYAITSWNANTGRLDAPSREILTALNSWRQNLPPHFLMLIVPDSELGAFKADSFPAGIVIRDGIVRWNSPTSSQGAERILVHALKGRADRP